MIALVQFAANGRLVLLLLLPVLFLMLVRAARRRRRTLEKMAGSGAAAQTRPARIVRRWRETWLLLGLALLVLAVARPWWKKEPADASAGGRDVLFLLDVSRSMLAADLSPNRLENARLAIYDCLERLEGNRVALVTFAGSSRIDCPFTTDYGFFRDRLAEAGPDNVAHGGTRIGDALEKALDKIIEDERSGLQDIVLLSDGGDQESSPAEAAAALGEKKVHLVVVGIGDPVTGARVPARPRSELERGLDAPAKFTIHKGREVWSRQETASLEKLAKSCELGVFLNAGTRPLDLGSVYLDLARHFEASGLAANEALQRPRDEFPWFVGTALLCLVMARLAPPFGVASAAPRKDSVFSPAPAPAAASSMMSLLVAVALLSIAAAPEQDDGSTGNGEPQTEIPTNPREAFRLGCEMFDGRSYAAAADCFRAALQDLGNDSLREAAAANLGRSLYRQAEGMRMIDVGLAAELYLKSADALRSRLDWDPGNRATAVALELARIRARECEKQLRDSQEGEDPAEQEGEQEQEQEGDPNAEGDPAEEEGEGEEGEPQGEAEATNQSSEQNAIDLDALDIPPPALDPEDIFQQQAEKDAAREKKSPGKYKAVERDW